jgi:hypothetical protein
MRHFLLPALPVGLLAGGVLPSSPQGSLVPATGSTERLAAPDRRTPVVAVNVAVITPSADPDLLAAPGAVVKPKPPVSIHLAPTARRDWTAGSIRDILGAVNGRCYPNDPRRRPGED